MQLMASDLPLERTIFVLLLAAHQEAPQTWLGQEHFAALPPHSPHGRVSSWLDPSSTAHSYFKVLQNIQALQSSPKKLRLARAYECCSHGFDASRF